MIPYYDADGIVIYLGRLEDVLPSLIPADFGVMLTDPPYGFGYRSGRMRATLADSIANDDDTAVRDAALEWWGDRPALVFGSWRVPPPAATRMKLIWDQGGALGMGALDLPWKPSWQEVYVLGRGFTGRRDGAVLRCPPVQSMAYNGREHPNEKPVRLLSTLLVKCPPGAVIDPCAGSGSTLVAAKAHGRSAVGIELEERYCEVAARRLAQGVLDLGGAT